MKMIHRLLDTRAKRELVVCILLFVLLGLECFYNSIFMARVRTITALEDLYDLIVLAKHGMLGRMIVAVFEATRMEVWSIVESMLRYGSWSFVWLFFLIGVVLGSSRSNRVLRWSKRMVNIVVWTGLVAIFVVAGYVVMNIDYTTYGAVLRQVKAVATFLLVIQGLGAIICGFTLCYLGYEMWGAMAYHAIELGEDE